MQSWALFRVRTPETAAAIADEAVANAVAAMEPCGVEQAETAAGTEWRIYFGHDTVPADFAPRLKQSLTEFEISNVVVSGPEDIQRENWHDNWRQYFRAVQIGDRLLVRPSWERGQPPEPASQGRIELFIEPGMAFGTGTHATTQLCMLLAQDHVQPAGRVLDIGTGSGILSIAAIKLGAGHAVATDLDEEVRENFDENRQLNDIRPHQIQLIIGPLESTPPGPYDLIFCNMLFNEFMPLLHELPARLASNATLLLSGLLLAEADEVEVRLGQLGLTIVKRASQEEWGAFAVKFE